MLALLDGDLATYRLGFGGQDKLEDGTLQPIPDQLMKHRVNEWVSDIVMSPMVACDEYKGYLTLDSESNFRNQIAVTVPYKGNRKAAKPLHYDLIREHLLSHWGFVGVTGQEADDSLAQKQTEMGLNSIIVSIDKDMLQVPGWHYNFVKKEKRLIDESEGFYNFCIQMLTGDRIDNIVGIRGIGPVKAARCLAKANNDKLRLEAVCRVYRQDGDDLLRRFTENAGLLWLRRRTDGAPELIDEMIKELV